MIPPSYYYTDNSASGLSAVSSAYAIYYNVKLHEIQGNKD